MSPIYVFRCPTGHEVEYVPRFGEQPPARCPKCGRKLDQAPTAPNLKRDGTYSYNGH